MGALRRSHRRVQGGVGQSPKGAVSGLKSARLRRNMISLATNMVSRANNNTFSPRLTGQMVVNGCGHADDRGSMVHGTAVLGGGRAVRRATIGAPPKPGWRNGRRGGFKIPCPKGRVGSSPTPGTQATIGLPDGSPPAYSSWLPSGRVVCHLPSGVRWIRKPFCFQRLCLPHSGAAFVWVVAPPRPCSWRWSISQRLAGA